MPSAAISLPALPPPSWLKAFRDLDHSYAFQRQRVEGQLPLELQGTLVRVGPVSFGVGGQRYGHWFDGDGGVLGVRLEKGEAYAAARAVETPSIQAEREAGKVLYSNYGTPAPSLWRRLFGGVKNAANTSALAWNGRLFALVEAAQPTELSLHDLRTIGETDLGGVLGPSFSAHPHAVGARRALYNFGVRYGAVTWLDLYELQEGGRVRQLGGLPLPGPVLVHDFIATERHLVFFLSPVRMRLMRMLLGRGSLSDNFEWRPELGTEVLVVPIDAPGRARRFQVEPFHSWHFANAFEQQGRIVVDYVRYPDFGSNQWLAEQLKGWASTETDGRLHRATLDVRAGTLHSEAVSDRRCEFPLVSPHHAGGRHRYVYTAGHRGRSTWRGPQDSVVKVDMDTGEEKVATFEFEHYPSEPIFVPHPNGKREDDGWLLTQTYDAPNDRTYVAVLDARTPEAGPVARVWLEHFFPFTFHGTWVPAR